MKSISWAFYGFLLVVLSTEGAGYDTYRQRITAAVGTALNDYQKDHPSSPLPDLGQLDGTYLDVPRIEHNLKSSLTNVFWILRTNSFRVPPPQQGQVVAVMSTLSIDPRYGTNAVRNVVFRDPDGNFRSRTFSESSLQAEAVKVGLQLLNLGTIEESIPEWGMQGLTNKPTSEIVPDGQGTKGIEGVVTSKPDNSQPSLSIQKTPIDAGNENHQPVASNSVPLAIATGTSGSGVSWIGIVLVLGMGLLFSIFLLTRAKQK